MTAGADRFSLPQPTRWAELYTKLAAESRSGPIDVEELERLAVAAHLVGRGSESAEAWAAAHRVWVRLGDGDRAARCAFWLGLDLLLCSEPARASGWFARGRRVLEGADDCAGAGYLLIPEAIAALEAGDVARCQALYEHVGEVAARCGDDDLSAFSLLGRGEAAIAQGDTRTAIALFDEVMVAAVTEQVSPLTIGILYCAVIDACVQVFDLRRAAEWTDALVAWCDGQRGLVPYRGQCLVHRSQVLQARGAWAEALAAAAQAGDRLAHPPHPAAGAAHYQRAELHRLRGAFAEAEAAYGSATALGRQPAPGLALLRLAQGKVDAAWGAIRRLSEEHTGGPTRLALLPAFVEIALAAGELSGAHAASEELTELAADMGAPVLTATALHAEAAVALAEGQPRDALDAARRSAASWRDLQMPYQAALAGELIGRACCALGDRDGGQEELRAARATFERIGAAPDAARVAGRATDPHPPTTVLTGRELEVLRRVAAGATNREAAEALFISEHTVARHLQNIFSKIEVSTRAAATAYAYEHHLL